MTERAELSIATRRVALGVIFAIALRAFRLAWGLPQLTFFDSAVFYAMPALRLIHEGTWRAVSLVRPPAKLPNDRSPRSTQALERFRAWLARERIDAVLLTEWRAEIARREGRAAELDVIAALGDGRLGFQRTAESRTSFFTEQLYTWADPSFAIAITAGILDHEPFLNEGHAFPRPVKQSLTGAHSPRGPSNPLRNDARVNARAIDRSGRWRRAT